MRAHALLAAVLLLSLAAAAPGAAQNSPYAGQERRAIKALSDEEVADLEAGRGMGLAKAAELNSYPGPLHILALGAELHLSDAQRAAVLDIRDRMAAAAKPLGAEILRRERELDQHFAERDMTKPLLVAETAELGELQGHLRAVHLAAHLEARQILSPEQIALYDRLRGYGAAAADGHDMHHRQGD